MRHFTRALAAAIVAGLCASAGASAYAQGSFFTSLSGTVVDSSGGIIPGADVKIKNSGTGEEFNTVSGSDGSFTVTTLPGGSYSVTVSLMGFKTVTLEKVTLQAAIPATVKVTLSVGALQENVTVVGESASIVQTATPAIATNMTSKQILGLPLSSRNALDSITSLPGFNTSGSSRGSTTSGLPRGAINITLDGMSIQDNYLKDTDGYFARLSPRLDAVEEVTVTTAGGTAESTMGGSAQIKFVTRSGSNKLSGSLYSYYQNDKFNANTWFNNRDHQGKAEINQKQTGGRIGGAIVIPGLFDGHDKAFFFFNYEQSSSPGASTLQRTILSPSALNGTFSYVVGVQQRNVDLLALAAANGQTATFDPRMLSVLKAIDAATRTTGFISDLGNPVVKQYTFQTPTKNFNPYPTARVDFNLTQKHRLTGSFNYQHINSTPDTTNSRQVRFPGFTNTGSQQSTRWTTSDSLRSTFSANIVNEFRVGATGGATFFSPEIKPDMFTGQTPEQYGIAFNIGANCCGSGSTLTNPYTQLSNSSRQASTYPNFDDTLTWLKGKHTITAGINYVQPNVWLANQAYVPNVQFNVVTGDPAEAMFTTANFPGAASADLTNARTLYALLTGRVSSVGGEARINAAGDAYTVFGASRIEGRQREIDFFASDSWRVRSNVTLTAGARYALQYPFYSVNNSLTQVTIPALWGRSGVGALFAPGSKGGEASVYTQYPKNTYAYKPDYNNIAPAVGATWAIGEHGGLVGRLLGADGDTVLRGSASVSYERLGSTNFTGVFGDNQGVALSRNRDINSGTLGPLPQLLRNPGSTALVAFPSTPVFPLAPTVSNNVNAFDPQLQVPYSTTWTAGIQRKVSRNSAVEVRWVGSQHWQGWINYNFNEFNVVENGFLNEFRKAQANLQANIAAGRGSTFAYTGAPGTAPLPTYLAFFNAQPSAQADNTALYTGSNWTSSTYINPLAIYNPSPYTVASNLQGTSSLRTNAINAGLPANFLVVNPDVNQVNLTSNGGYTKANSVQFEYRKRLSSGIAYSANYTFSKAYQSNRYSLRTPRVSVLQTGTDGDVTHALKANWVVELPFGRGRRFGTNATRLVDALVGGWEFDGVARIQTGENLDFGNVRVVGMTRDEFRKSIGLRFVAGEGGGGPNGQGAGQVYLLPADIVDNTIKAFNTSATDPTGYAGGNVPAGRYLAPANGPNCIELGSSLGTTASSASAATVLANSLSAYGSCTDSNHLILTGPSLHAIDLSAVKRFNIYGSTNVELRIEALNAFNQPYFTPRAAIGTTDSSYRLTGTQLNPRVVQFVFRLNF